MKIYELEQSKRVDMFTQEKSIKEFTPIAETDKDIEVCSTIKIYGKYYTVCSKMTDNSYAIVEKINISDKPEEDLYGEDYITCPVCHEQNKDSFDYDDGDENYKCSYCGSVFSYQRVVNVTYNMQLKKRGDIQEIC